LQRKYLRWEVKTRSSLDFVLGFCQTKKSIIDKASRCICERAWTTVTFTLLPYIKERQIFLQLNI
jgi:hypothetical protein